MRLWKSVFHKSDPLSSKTRLHRAACPGFKGEVSGTYFIGTNKGVLLLDPSGLYQVYPHPCYGVAAVRGRVYLGVHTNRKTALVSFPAESFGCGASVSIKPEVLYSLGIPDSGRRIHQVTGSEANGTLWFANTARNTLLQLELGESQGLREYAPFTDAFGAPILYDHNHLNSIVDYGEYRLFVAYRAGGQSMVFLWSGDTIEGFGYKNRGAHDIYLTNDGILVNDTFGSEKKDGKTGRPLVWPQDMLDTAVFDSDPGYIVRGAAANSNGELLIGHSHKGTRSKRYDGQGAVLVFRDGSFVKALSLPGAAQVYQITRSDGTFFPIATAPKLTEVRRRLGELFGEMQYSGKMLEIDSSLKKWKY